jgi:hypothetical protein
VVIEEADRETGIIQVITSGAVVLADGQRGPR